MYILIFGNHVKANAGVESGFSFIQIILISAYNSHLETRGLAQKRHTPVQTTDQLEEIQIDKLGQ